MSTTNEERLRRWRQALGDPASASRGKLGPDPVKMVESRGAGLAVDELPPTTFEKSGFLSVMNDPSSVRVP